MHLQLLFLHHRLVVFMMMMMMKMGELLQYCCFYYVLFCCAVRLNPTSLVSDDTKYIQTMHLSMLLFLSLCVALITFSFQQKNMLLLSTVHEINFFLSKALQKNLVIAFPSHISYNGLLITTRHV